MHVVGEIKSRAYKEGAILRVHEGGCIKEGGGSINFEVNMSAIMGNIERGRKN